MAPGNAVKTSTDAVCHIIPRVNLPTLTRMHVTILRLASDGASVQAWKQTVIRWCDSE